MKLNNKRNKTNYSNQKGITLIALVITIVVLLILAGVSLNAIFSENGIINKAQDAQNKMNQATQNDLDAIDGLSNWIDSKTNGNSGGSTGGNTTGGGDNPITPATHPSEKIISNETGKTVGKELQKGTVIAQDIKGNQVVVPGGFRIADDSGTSVEQGIVIEDGSGNQFVWVPVSNINADESNKIIKDDGSPVEITLGRYKFATSSSGTPTLIQKGSEYDKTTAENVGDETVEKYRVEDYFYELSGSRTSNESSGTDGTNTTAKKLEDFITKTETNKGFYIARYEASYGSGYDSSKSTATEKIANAKPLSKVSTANSESSMNYNKPGTLWNYITQPQAAIVSQNMYKDDKYVESDLVNSYAWDTAIVYIQAMGNSNYANQADGNGTLKNTGKTGDQKCKIFDMAGNTIEWTTEYSTRTVRSNADPCTFRGGSYNLSGYYTSNRNSNIATGSDSFVSFRPLFYVK